MRTTDASYAPDGAGKEEGRRKKGGAPGTRRLTPWAKFFRPSRGYIACGRVVQEVSGLDPHPDPLPELTTRHFSALAGGTAPFAGGAGDGSKRRSRGAP